MTKILSVAAIMAAVLAAPAVASTADVMLAGFIQSGTVTNSAGSTANITSIIYSLGAPGDGIATWDTGTAGGTASDFLSDPQYFQTVTFGVNIAPSLSFSFGSLDIDYITTLSPLSVTGGTLDEIGSSLIGAYVSVFWSDGTSGTTNLTQQAWSTTQNFSVNSVSEVPLPAALPMMLVALGGLGFAARRRKAA